MTKLDKLKNIVRQLPHLPGVYQYKNQLGKIIYIGKAKDLQKRVSTYFNQEHDLKTNLLVNQIDQIEYTITPTEIDALTLEDQLIREHQPHYNILLKTNSSYRYICLTKNNPPQITACRKLIKNQICLGPFPFATSEIVKIARDILGLTKNQSLTNHDWQIYLDAANFYKNKSNQALDPQVYQKFITKLIKTIKHGDQDLINAYQKKMSEHATQLEFEQALIYKHKIELLNKLTQRTSNITANKNRPEHLIIYTSHANQILIFIFNIKNGLLHSLEDFKFSQDFPDNILEAFLKQYYSQHEPPAKILIYLENDRQTSLQYLPDPLISKYLNSIWSSEPDIQIITKHKLLNLALQNVAAKLNHKDNLNHKLKILLNLEHLPKVIDFIDISNLSDQINVGGVIRFIDTKPVKQFWRHYTIKTVIGQDDYASISETILRRYQKISYPDVLIVDGGLGQLNAALKSLPKKSPVAVFGLAKSEETLIFTNHANQPLDLKKSPDKFIIKGRDNVHNFVISHTRAAFKKNYKQSELDHVPGIGPSTKLKLLTNFKSVAQIKLASLDALIKIVGPHKALIIHNYFKI